MKKQSVFHSLQYEEVFTHACIVFRYKKGKIKKLFKRRLFSQ
ncbi:uncharacterized protein MP3633_0784 [Marinomonas primoryensis]|uniref:Uncharacterized protein n=1 Tax=Marinomonas primoryensis TaxID=178399 RepID=A0A859CYG2_9GAMM|nr:uncharacterized protein MP3633_0784 [Marinomonas primoryensis]